MSGNFDSKVISMVPQAPQDIREAYMRLVQNDNDGVLRLCPDLVSKYGASEDRWGGPAAAWLAFALSMDDQFKRSLEICAMKSGSRLLTLGTKNTGNRISRYITTGHHGGKGCLNFKLQ